MSIAPSNYITASQLLAARPLAVQSDPPRTASDSSSSVAAASTGILARNARLGAPSVKSLLITSSRPAALSEPSLGGATVAPSLFVGAPSASASASASAPGLRAPFLSASPAGGALAAPGGLALGRETGPASLSPFTVVAVAVAVAVAAAGQTAQQRAAEAAANRAWAAARAAAFWSSPSVPIPAPHALVTPAPATSLPPTPFAVAGLSPDKSYDIVVLAHDAAYGAYDAVSFEAVTAVSQPSVRLKPPSYARHRDEPLAAVTALTVPFDFFAAPVSAGALALSACVELHTSPAPSTGLLAGASGVDTAYAKAALRGTLQGLADARAAPRISSGTLEGAQLASGYTARGAFLGPDIAPGQTLVLFGAAEDPLNNGPLAFQAWDVTTRVPARAQASPLFVGRRGARFRVDLALDDPVPGRSNEASAAWTVAPASTPDAELKSWLLPRDLALDGPAPPLDNAWDPRVPVGEARNLAGSNLSAVYSLDEDLSPGGAARSPLQPYTDYELVYRVRDLYLPAGEGDRLRRLPFRTRGDLAVSVALAPPRGGALGANPREFSLTARVDASLQDARLPSGSPGDAGLTYSLRLLVRRKDTLSPDDVRDLRAAAAIFDASSDWVQVAARETQPTLARDVALAGLVSGKRYYVIALATDDATGESSHAFFEAATGTLPPSLAVRYADASDTAATLFVDVRDADSSFRLYAAAYPAGPASPPPDDLASEGGRAALKTRASRGNDAGGHEGEFSGRITGAPLTTSFTVAGLLPGQEYVVLVLVEDPDGNLSHASAPVSTKATQKRLNEAEYDDGLWEISWNSNAIYSSPVRGAPVGNGRIEARQSLEASPAARLECLTVAARPARAPRPPTPGFDPAGFTFDDPSADPSVERGAPLCIFRPARQTLALRSGLSSTAYAVAFPHAEPAASNPAAAALAAAFDGATCEAFCPRTMPYFSAATFGVRATGGLQGAVLYQTMTAPPWGRGDAQFDGGLVYVPRGGRSAFLLSGLSEGPAAAGGAGAEAVACASAYLFSEEFTEARPLGFNSLSAAGDRPALGFAAFSLSCPPNTAPTLTVLSAHVTSSEFADPLGEARRMVLTALGAKTRNGRETDGAAARRLRAEHALSWDAAWRSGVEVDPRPLTAEDVDGVREVRRCLRQAQYAVLSSVGDETGWAWTRAEGSGGAASVFRGAASGFGGAYAAGIAEDAAAPLAAELWLVPALIFLRPRSAKNLLSRRFDELEAAREFARAQGLDGARFPQSGDIVGLGRAPYYDLTSSGYVFPSCLVALGAWSYFLATQDMEWLAAKGYSILSAVADMLVSAAQVTEASAAAPGLPTATFGNAAVLDLAGDAVTDGVLTVFLARQALRAAAEATYALRYPTRQSWVKLYAALRVDLLQIPANGATGAAGALVSVPKPHADFAAAGAPNPPHSVGAPRLLDSLVALGAYWNDPYSQVPQDAPSLAAADRFFSALLTVSDAGLGANLLTRVGVRARSESAEPAGTSAVGSAAPGVESTLALILSAIRGQRADVWGAPNLAFSAQFILVFLTGIAGVRVEGGFNPSGTTYRPLGIRASKASSHFPKSWSSVRVRTEKGAPIRLSTGTSIGEVLTDDLVVSNSP